MTKTPEARAALEAAAKRRNISVFELLAERLDRREQRTGKAVRRESAPPAPAVIQKRAPAVVQAITEAELVTAFAGLGLTAEGAIVAARGRNAGPRSLEEAGRALGLDAAKARTFAAGRN